MEERPADTSIARPHGYDLPADEHRLLRSRPPAVALAWAAAAFGRRARVVRATAQPGGRSSAIHALTVEDAQGRRHRVVLRRYVRADLQAEEPDMPEREVAVLGLLERADLPAPRLIATDLSGHECGAPAILMTLLPGRVDWEPRDLDRYLVGLAEPLPVIHAIDVPPSFHLRTYAPYEIGRPIAPPRWTRFPRAWNKAIERYQAPPPTFEGSFIHRDYHPGNVLWRRRRVTGIVDWQSASLGSPEADVGHCRWNLLYLSPAAADRFLAIWQSRSGRDSYDPYWDIAAVVDTPESYGDPDPVLDRWVAAAMAELA